MTKEELANKIYTQLTQVKFGSLVVFDNISLDFFENFTLFIIITNDNVYSVKKSIDGNFEMIIRKK